MKEIRDYFRQQILKIDNTLKEWERDLFGNNNVVKTQAECYYNLIIGAATAVRTGNGIYDEFPVNVIIYSSSKRDVLGAFDALYDKAIAIRNSIICYPDVYQGYPTFIDIEPISITPSEETTNDNTIKLDLLFTVRKGFDFKP